MTFIKAFGIGLVAVLVIEVALSFLLNVIGVSQNWPTTRVALGPLTLFAFTRTSSGYSVETGSGLLVVALAAGLLNGLGALLLERSGSRLRD
jgi:hypothetical protein